MEIAKRLNAWAAVIIGGVLTVAWVGALIFGIVKLIV
jgi:hypothetical protein